eukprot:superscaffoldBa00004354_g18740
MRSFFEHQELRGIDCCFCAECGKKTPSKQGVKLLSLPPILCVHLKRFRNYRGYTRKLDCKVTFPETFDLSEIPPEAFSADFAQNDCKYTLYAVVVHSGTAMFGHYTAYVRDKREQCWYYADDSHVEKSAPYLSSLSSESGSRLDQPPSQEPSHSVNKAAERPCPSHLQPVMVEREDDIILVSERRLVIGPLSSSSGTGQTEHTSGARQCKSDALGFSRVAGGASVQTESQEASKRGAPIQLLLVTMMGFILNMDSADVAKRYSWNFSGAPLGRGLGPGKQWPMINRTIVASGRTVNLLLSQRRPAHH